MIKRILTYYAERLDEYLSHTRRQPEGLATVGLIGSGNICWDTDEATGSGEVEI